MAAKKKAKKKTSSKSKEVALPWQQQLAQHAKEGKAPKEKASDFASCRQQGIASASYKIKEFRFNHRKYKKIGGCQKEMESCVAHQFDIFIDHIEY